MRIARWIVALLAIVMTTFLATFNTGVLMFAAGGVVIGVGLLALVLLRPWRIRGEPKP